MSTERHETEKQKNERRRQEVTVYRVQEDFGRKSGVYRIAKRTIDVETDVYHVTYRGDGEPELFCDCPGFIRQKFDKARHKHIRVVADYLKRGLTGSQWAEYNFRGSGRNTKIKFVRQGGNGDT